MRRSVFVPAFVIASFATPVFAHEYELKDLEALEKQESWQEAVQHLGDIPPSKRNDTWQRIAEKSGAGYLAAQEGRATLSIADDLVKRYPTLKKSKVFMAGRTEAGLKAFGKTYSDSRHSAGDDPWMDQLKKFVEEDAVTADLPLRAGKLVTSRLVAYIAIPFFKKAINANASACKDADVKKSLVSALADNVWQDDAKALVEKSCFAEVRGEIEAQLAKSPEGALKTNACPILAAKKVSVAACK